MDLFLHNYRPAFPFWPTAVQLTLHNHVKMSHNLFRNSSPNGKCRFCDPKGFKGRLNRVLCRSMALWLYWCPRSCLAAYSQGASQGIHPEQWLYFLKSAWPPSAKSVTGGYLAAYRCMTLLLRTPAWSDYPICSATVCIAKGKHLLWTKLAARNFAQGSPRTPNSQTYSISNP